MNDMTPARAELEWLSPADLDISPLNTRQAYPEQEVADMAASIATVGLIQNLSGHRTEGGAVQIVAGGKRLRALQRLAGETVAFAVVPVRVTDDPAEARAWSMAENTARSRPHPGDEIRAFRKLHDTGVPVDTIARSFAEHPDHVKRRLKLASLPDDVLDALRADQISLATAQALTLATSTDQQSQLLAQLAQGTLHPNGLRSALQRDSVPATDRRVKFAGLNAYIGLGGTVTEDLFGDSSLLHDEKLLNDLFKSKLKDAAEHAREEEGWVWATPIFEGYLGYNHTENLEKIWRTPGDLTEADSERFDELAGMEDSGALDEAGLAELDALQKRLDGDFTDEDRTSSGIFVLVDSHGELQIYRAYRRPADKPSPEPGPDGATAPADDQVERDAKPAITAAMQDDLHCIARRALQSAVVAKFQLVLDLLAFQLENNAPSYRSPFNIQVTPERIAPEKDHGMQDDPRLAAADAREVSYHQTPEQMLTDFTDFREKGTAHRNQVLTQGLVRALQLPQGATEELGRLVAQEAGMSIRRHWTPGVELFKSARPDVLDKWWADLLALEDGDARIASFGKMKKGEKVKALAELFADTGVQEAHGLSRDQIAAIDAWLPPQLEGWG